VRIQDFGIAAVLCSGLDDERTIRLGRASYLSPERLQGRAKGGSQDVYALGMIGLACVLGGLPERLPVAPAQRLAALRAAIAQRDLPLPLTELLLGMIAAPPERLGAAEVARHARRMIAQSPGQWLEDLAPRVVPAALGRPAPEPAPDGPVPRPVRRLAVLAGLAVGFGAVGAAGVALATLLLCSGLV
jgi:hypothetical protein